MSKRVLRTRADVCQLCNSGLARQNPLRQLQWSQRTSSTIGRISTSRRSYVPKSQKLIRPSHTSEVSSPRRISTGHDHPKAQLSQSELARCWEEVRTTCNLLLSSEGIPLEEQTIHALNECNSLAELLVLEPPSLIKKHGAASALLSLDDSSGAKKIPLQKLPVVTQRTVDDLSQLAYSIIKHPPVFITPDILELYVKIQANLSRPQTLPEVFNLYTDKPLPREGTPIRYSRQNPNKVANAVPVAVADRALQAAIDSKQLVVAMDIVQSTYTTTAFHRAKFVRKGLLPATAAAAAPIAAYAVASQLALLQTTMESTMATNVAFAGILAYVFFTGTIGVVAVTTANDQMDRVTWAPGIPLRERWMREEERAAIDKIAGSWGFRETWRRGEEEGEDWDALREWIGRKGLILDRVSLMEGME